MRYSEANHIFYSLDTNLVIALVNDSDRLSMVTKSILATNSDVNDCLLCRSVLKEAKKVFRQRLSETIIGLIPFLLDLKESDNFKEKKQRLSDVISVLISKKPHHENFYRFLQTKIEQYLEQIGVNTLPTFLANLTDNVVRTFDAEVQRRLVFRTISVDFNDESVRRRYIAAKRSCAPIRFKDNIDFDIFCELVLNLSDQRCIRFYTDDEEFIKKGDKAYDILLKELPYKPHWLSLSLVRNT